MSEEAQTEADAVAHQEQAFERSKPSQSIYEAFPNKPLEFVMAEDGLPKPKVPDGIEYAPPLTPTTLVCMADLSSFVFRDGWGEVVLRVDPADVKQSEGGAWYIDSLRLRELVADLSLEERQRIFEAVERVSEEAALHLDAFATPSAIVRSFRIQIDPVRPACKHYARQLMDLEQATDVLKVERLCMARKDAGSLFLSLSDSQMFACEIREPRDVESRVRLDKFDDGKVRLGRERLVAEGFAVDKKLGDLSSASEPISYGGIFRSGV